MEGLGGACAESMQPQPPLFATAATSEMTNTTTLHNFEIAPHMVAESSHLPGRPDRARSGRPARPARPAWLAQPGPVGPGEDEGIVSPTF